MVGAAVQELERPRDASSVSRATPDIRPLSMPADFPFVVLALCSAIVLLFLGRSLTFWEDEWLSITFDGGLLDYLRPVNQHWQTFPLLLYRATFAGVGLRSYLPYLAEVILVHLIAVAAGYALMRRRVGPLVATLGALPLLLLGSGAENLLWAYQTGFVGSMMFGLWALYVLERPSRRSTVVASALLIGSLMSSGMGVVFVFVAAARAVLDPRLRVRALAAVPPFVVYVAWFNLVGRDVLGRESVYLEPALARFVVRGVLWSSERVSGLDHLPDGPILGMALFLGVSAVTVLQFARGRGPALAAGCMLGVVAMYSVVAVGRLHADPGYDHATASRFVYFAGFFLVLAVIDLLPRCGAWSTSGGWRKAALPAVFAVAIAYATVANVADLRAKRAELQDSADLTRAFVQVALARGQEPWVDRTAPRGWMPSIAELERVVELHGSPVQDALFHHIEPPDARTSEAALLALAGDAYRIATPVTHRRPARVTVGGGAYALGRCAAARLSPGFAVRVAGVPAHTRVRLTWSRDVSTRVFLAHEGGPARALYGDFEAGIAQDVVLPSVGDRRPWVLSVDTATSEGVVTLCVLLPSGDTSRPPRVEVRAWDA